MKKRVIQFSVLLAVVLFVVMVFLSPFLWAKDFSTITGTIYDSETGEPLPGVTIMVKGTKMGTYSDLDGHFKLRDLKPGTYTLIFSVIGYKDSRIADLQVNAGESKRLDDILLAPEAVKVKGVEVTAKRVTHSEAALLRIQMKAPAISDGISAQQIARSPDSDAASALKRVTGITVVGGKYVYVRGMGERYSNTLLNGAPLPSPEPKKRVIPMDLIPANLLENVVVTKTSTPDQWGNFSGGSVRLKTKEFPEKLTLRFSVSSGWNSQTTGKTFYKSPSGETDWLGIDDGTRDIPSKVDQAINGGHPKGAQGVSNQELAQSFRQVWDGMSKKAPLNQNYSFSIGNQTELLSRPFGFIFSLTYDNKYNYRNEIQNFYNGSNSGMQARSSWNIEKSTFSVLWGGIFNLNYKLHPYHKLRVNTTYTRSADDEVRWMEGDYEDWKWLESQLKWVEQSLAHFRLTGQHQLPALFSSRLEWNASYGEAKRKEPDKSALLWSNTRPESDTLYRLESQKTSKYRTWDDTKDENFSFSSDWTKDFKQWGGLPAKFKLGWSLEKMDRDDHRRYFKVLMRAKNRFFEGRPADECLEPPTDVRFVDSQSYWAEKKITAGYVLFDMPIFKSLRAIAGIRAEGTDMEFTLYPTGSGNDPSRQITVTKNYTEWLPSVNLSYSLTESMNLRFAVARTITRPEYFELIPREDIEIFENLKSFGNPELEHTRIWNYDTRWELYPRPGEVLAVSLFYKKFDRPVEQVYTMMGTPTLKPINVEGAHNYGVELEIRKQLDFLGIWMSNFSVNANYALISSKVEIGELSNMFGVTNKERALIGQSPYALNLTLGYENKHGTSARLLYNRFGERIAYPGASGNPDIVEEPFDQLDFTFEQKLFHYLGLKLKATNLSNSEVEFTQGGKLWRLYKKGVNYSMGLSYSI